MALKVRLTPLPLLAEGVPERTPELFEKFLPYALALGVEQKWSEQFSTELAAAVDVLLAYHLPAPAKWAAEMLAGER